ncbi:MAG: phosphatidate cytidylyltransferase [candidate division KSB1 bacterium]|nr:phosphatidate cytidylyltransferase [candidate division KSB1 bacterium]
MRFETLGKRLIVAGIFIPLILFTTLKGGWPFVVIVTIIVGVASVEFYGLARLKAAYPQTGLGVAATVLVPSLLYLEGPAAIWVGISLLTLLVVSVELFRNRGSATTNVATTLCGILFVPLLLGHLVLIRQLPVELGLPYKQSGTWLVLMLITVWVCDTAAYGVGTAMGRHKLFVRISPKKTWEGAIAGFCAALVCAWACHALFVTGLRLGDSLVIGALCGTVGQLSDLTESQFKRDAGVKDSSTLIPGHGGMLDRFDSFLLLAPVAYYYLRFIALA